MRHIPCKTAALSGAMMIAVVFFRLALAPPSPAENISYNNGGYPLREPQATFSLPNAGDMNAAPGSLFSLSSPSNNNIAVTGGTIDGNVFGGIDPTTGGSGGADGNTVAISGGTTQIGRTAAYGRITGGWSYRGSVRDNVVTITDAEVKGIVYGAWIRGGTQGVAENNSVSTNTLESNIYGAYSQGSGGAIRNNSVTISGGDASGTRSSPGLIAGGYSALGTNDVSGNTATISGGAFSYYAIHGGRALNAHAGDDAAKGVRGNHLVIDGATIGNNVILYGGRADSSGTVAGNTVSVGVNANTVLTDQGADSSVIYGGYAGRGQATGNAVTIGSRAAGSISQAYGGHVGAGGGDAFTGNILNKNGENARILAARNFQTVNFGYSGNANIDSLDTTATGVKGGPAAASGVTVNTGGGNVVFGGSISGTGDLKKSGAGTLVVTGADNAVTHAGGVRVQEGDLQFGAGAGGGATGNIAASLFTVDSGASLSYNHSNAVAFGGTVAGEGTLRNIGGGTLTLTSDNNTVRNVHIVDGAVQLGAGAGGGASGKIVSSGARQAVYLIEDGAELIFNHSNAVTENGLITGAGKVIQRGGGELMIRNPNISPLNSFTGGTEVESGTLVVRNTYSLNAAQGNLAGEKKGYVTFTKSGGEKHIVFSGEPAGGLTVHNSFRTETAAPQGNHIDLSKSRNAWISGVGISDPGGAFYVAPGTEMDVSATFLMLTGNQAAGKGNDLYVGDGGTFNLTTGSATPSANGYWETVFKSGIDGEGTLNLYANAATAEVSLVNEGSASNTFAMKTTNVVGSAGKLLALNLERGGGAGSKRVVFENADSFNISGTGAPAAVITDIQALLTGDGIVAAGTTPGTGGGISLTGGAGLMPYYAMRDEPGTLTLKSATDITLDGFTLAYVVGGSQAELTSDAGTGGYTVPVSNNSLLDLSSESPVTMDNGNVSIITRNGAPFSVGNYLLMRSNQAFQDGGGRAIDSDPLLNEALTVYVDGFRLSGGQAGLRGNFNLAFGGAPEADNTTGIPAVDSLDANHYVWLGQTLNSLSMEWTGNASRADPVSGEWGEEDFSSFQTDGGMREHSFLSGDKVYVSGTSSFEIDATPHLSTAPSTKPFTPEINRIVVSGLVVGQDASGNIAPGGSYVISGSGGITAARDSAFGKYVETGAADELAPTGKLEKYGDSVLTFANTGGNVFREGIELHGGRTRFSQADQLGLGGNARIVFGGDPVLDAGGDAALEAVTSLTLTDRKVHINDDFTAGFSAVKGAVFTYTGAFTVLDSNPSSGDPVLDANGNTLYAHQEAALTGGAASTFNKSGAGTVILPLVTVKSGGAELVPVFGGKVAVSEGLLVVHGNYGAVSALEVKSGGTLSGTGTLGGAAAAGFVRSGGVLRPGGLSRFSGAATPPVENPLNIGGDLTFNAGGNFSVRIARPAGRGYSDSVTLSGKALIESGATLDVDIDYWAGSFNFQDPGRFTIITAGAAPDDPAAEFTTRHISYLPRGVILSQGWNAANYQLWFGYDANQGFGKIPGGSHNENEVGDNIDWAIRNKDPGLSDLIDRVSDPGWSDAQVLAQLDQLSGDLSANALYMAFKEPWRHPFRRLDQAFSLGAEKEAPLHQPRVWAELSSRYEHFSGDGNARGFTLNRAGVAFGVDTRIAPHSIVGAAFRYTRPHLEQSNGDVYADDFEAGLYGMTRLPGEIDMKMYIGYSRQQYDFSRVAALPATPSGRYSALREGLEGNAGGDALAASVELVRPVPLGKNFQLLPLAAFDYEKAWMSAWRESGGQTELRYEAASMERSTLRFGLGGEFNWRDRLGLKTWVQFAARIGGEDYPTAGARFARATLPNQPLMRIYGAKMGYNYVNLGLNASWKLDEKGDRLVYVNYDAKLNDRMSGHAGELGFMITW